MRPPLRSIKHTKSPRADHNTGNTTSTAALGSIARHWSPGRDAKCLLLLRRGVANYLAGTSRKPQEQRSRLALVMDGRPSFPPPPVLGRSMLGAADMPIGCALNFSVLSAIIDRPEGAGRASAGQAHALRPYRRTRVANAEGVEIRASLGARPACARAAAICGRRTAPD
jgi:hypothetical protein